MPYVLSSNGESLFTSACIAAFNDACRGAVEGGPSGRLRIARAYRKLRRLKAKDHLRLTSYRVSFIGYPSRKRPNGNWR